MFENLWVIRAKRNKITKYERLWMNVSLFFNCVDSSTYDVTLEFLNILGCSNRMNRGYYIYEQVHMHLKQIV